MITNPTPLERQIALQAFVESLDKATAILAEAKEAYRIAQERHRVLTALVSGLREEGEPLNGDVLTRVPSEPKPVATPKKKLGGTKKPTNSRMIGTRNELMALIIAEGAIRSTAEILTLVRKDKDQKVPSSTVVSALAQLATAKKLVRKRDVEKNTSYYGLPEWFNEGEPKPEFAYGF